MKFRNAILTLATALLVSAAASAEELKFRSGTWHGNENFEKTGCSMLSPFSDGSGSLVVEMVDGSEIYVGIYWHKETYPNMVGKSISGRILVDQNPALELEGSFVRDDYLRFSSTSKGLLKHIFTAGSRGRLEYDGEGWATFDLSGTSKAVNQLHKCLLSQNILNIARSQNQELSDNKAEKGLTVSIGANQMIDWKGPENTLRSYEDDLSVMITKYDRNGEDRLQIRVQKDGKSPLNFEMETKENPAGQIGLYDIGHGEKKLVVTTFTGGAHCCVVVDLVDFSGSTAKLLEVGSFDGDSFEPEDADGDGIFELVVLDKRFLYTFGGYASSSPPSVIWTVSDGLIGDVTRQPQYARFHEKAYSRQAEACGFEVAQVPGACAGWAATAAILGVLPETLQYINFDDIAKAEGTEPLEIKICADAKCGHSVAFDNYEKALAFALDSWGYKAEHPDQDFLDLMSKLVGRSFGTEQPDSEFSCKLGPRGFSRENGPLRSILFQISGYESGCTVSSGIVSGPSVFMRAVCQGEGSPPWIEHNAYTLENNGVSVAVFGSTVPMPTRVDQLQECGKE